MGYYKINDLNNNSFFKIPKTLMENDCYSGVLNSDAKIIYALLLDRMELSRKNKWVNEEGEIYLLFTKDELANMLKLSPATVYKAFKTLEKCRLIRQERQGRNKPNRIYIGKARNIKPVIPANNGLSRICKICRSGCLDFVGQDLQNLKGSKTYLSNTNTNKTESYTAVKNRDLFIWEYFNLYENILGKKHPILSVEQLEEVLSNINKLRGEGLKIEEWIRESGKHLDNLPATNNGNIIPFLMATKRYFDIDLIYT